MQALVRLDGDDIDTLRALRAWLAAEPAARTHGRPTGRPLPPPAEGGMGAVEVISLILGSGFSAAQLVLAIAAWRASRPRPPAVVITIDEPGGATVRIESADPAALAAAASALEAAGETR